MKLPMPIAVVSAHRASRYWLVLTNILGWLLILAASWPGRWCPVPAGSRCS